MTDFTVTAPDATPIFGTPGSDRLIFNLASGPGGVTLTGLSANLAGGYDGTFDVAGSADTSFVGIENFSFHDLVGGKDVITTGDGDDELQGGGGGDILRGGDGSNSLIGNAGWDRLYGGADFDQLDGGNGNDRLFGYGGGDSLIGGAGNDRIFGGAGDDFVDAGAGDDVVKSGSGDDFIISGAGDDTILMGLGKDFLEISLDGAKTIDGGKGHDAVFAFLGSGAPAGSVFKYSMISGEHGLKGATANQSTITNVEEYAMVGDIDARLIGDGKDNTLSTDLGDDVLTGNGGRDNLSGGGGNDRLIGNKGADTLNGGAGDDILRGGAGKDSFVFGAGLDVIRDFRDDWDKIGIDSDLLAPGETLQDVVDNRTSVVAGDTLVTFDAGNVLTIEGLSDPSLLSNDLVLI